MDHSLFESLRNDVINLHVYWKVYRQLFAHSEERINLLNQSGSLVFHLAQNSFLNEIILYICRLTEPDKTFKKENHTFQLLVKKVAIVEKEFSQKLESELTEIKNKSEYKALKKWRNLSIAHSDLLTKLKYEENPLPNVSKENIEQILKDIRGLMKNYEDYFKIQPMCYQNPHTRYIDGDFLVQQLKSASLFRNTQQN